jgi:hypothetical protein
MLSISISEHNRKLTYSSEFVCTSLAATWTGAFSHLNDNSTFIEAYFIHQRVHQVDSTTMNGFGIFGGCRIHHLNLMSNPRRSSFTAMETSSGLQRQRT